MTAMDYAKYFISQRIGAEKNSLEGNMKLQKLLFFADIIHLAQYNTPLFNDTIFAFEKGCVIESVRHRFQYDYGDLCFESMKEQYIFCQQDKNTLDMTIAIFGGLSSKELSDLNHQFNFWQDQYSNSIVSDTFKEKYDSIVTIEMMRSELDKMKGVLNAYYQTKLTEQNVIVFNGIRFFYGDDVFMTVSLKQYLCEFSMCAEDDSYSVYYDNGELVVY